MQFGVSLQVSLSLVLSSAGSQQAASQPTAEMAPVSAADRAALDGFFKSPPAVAELHDA